MNDRAELKLPKKHTRNISMGKYRKREKSQGFGVGQMAVSVGGRSTIKSIPLTQLPEPTRAEVEEAYFSLKKALSGTALEILDNAFHNAMRNIPNSK